MQLVNGSWRNGLHGAGTTLGVFAVVTRGSDVYVGGEFHLAGDVIVHNLARWDGSSWHAVGGGINGVVYALAFDSAGNLYAAGGFATAGGTPARGIAKWDGASWSGSVPASRRVLSMHSPSIPQGISTPAAISTPFQACRP
jgi:hypothetical protein